MRHLKSALALLLTLLTVTALLPRPALALSNEAVIYQFLVGDMGLNEAAACGVLANIECESDFRISATGDGGTSYGICQWHNSRWEHLKQYRPTDWNTLRGQLEFMRYELLHDKTSVWRFLRTVTNDANGAYLAGHYWCFHFEIPKNYPTVSVRRGNLARSSYWPKYMGRGSGEGGVPCFTGVICPDTLRQGQECQLYGTVYSDTPLARMSVILTDQQGRLAAPETAFSPYTNTYTLHTLGRHIPFDTLAPGDYLFTITASNGAGSTPWQQTVTILPSASATQSRQRGPLARLLEEALPPVLTQRGRSALTLAVSEALAAVLRMRV